MCSSSRYFLSMFIRTQTLWSQSVSGGHSRESNDLERQRRSISQSTSSVERSETLHSSMFDLSSARSSRRSSTERRRIPEILSETKHFEQFFSSVLSEIISRLWVCECIFIDHDDDEKARKYTIVVQSSMVIVAERLTFFAFEVEALGEVNGRLSSTEHESLRGEETTCRGGGGAGEANSWGTATTTTTLGVIVVRDLNVIP